MNNAVNHRNMRILLILILSIFSFMFCFNQLNKKYIFAEPSYTPKVTIESKTIHRGQTFSVDVNLSNNEGLVTLLLILNYDRNAMTLKNVVLPDESTKDDFALSSLTHTLTNVGTELGYSIENLKIFFDSEAKTRDTSNGTICKLVFDSLITAPVGEYVISMSYETNNTLMDYEKPIDIEIENGIITFQTGAYWAIYRDWNGTKLSENDYSSDQIPEYSGEQPFRLDDERYVYEFKGWKGVVSDQTNVIIYEADYELIPKVYTLFFYIDGINGVPDGEIHDDDYFCANDYAYDSYIDLPDAPFKQYYQFNGWYTDDGFTKVLDYAKMPAKKTTLYAYYSYEVKEVNIPLITLNTEELTTNKVVITAELVKNTGLVGLVLTLDYDSSVLRYTGAERMETLAKMAFLETGTESVEEIDIKFSFDYSENIYETGKFLKLYFDIIDSEKIGTYDVTFKYDYHTDATYKDSNGEIKYTKLEIIKAEVPIGEIYHWNEDLSNGRNIDVRSRDGKPINVKLSVELVTEKIYIEQEKVEDVVGKKMYLQSAYSIKLMQNNKEIQPNTMLTIRIKLTYQERQCKVLKLYYYNDDNELEEYDFTIDNEGKDLVFNTDHLSNWLIFGDYNMYKGFESDSKVVMLIMYPILLAITTMTYAFIQKGKFTKIKNSKNLNKEAHNE